MYWIFRFFTSSGLTIFVSTTSVWTSSQAGGGEQTAWRVIDIHKSELGLLLRVQYLLSIFVYFVAVRALLVFCASCLVLSVG